MCQDPQGIGGFRADRMPGPTLTSPGIFFGGCGIVSGLRNATWVVVKMRVPFLGYPKEQLPYYNRYPKGTLVLTTTHMLSVPKVSGPLGRVQLASALQAKLRYDRLESFKLNIHHSRSWMYVLGFRALQLFLKLIFPRCPIQGNFDVE